MHVHLPYSYKYIKCTHGKFLLFPFLNLSGPPEEYMRGESLLIPHTSQHNLLGQLPTACAKVGILVFYM